MSYGATSELASSWFFSPARAAARCCLAWLLLLVFMERTSGSRFGVTGRTAAFAACYVRKKESEEGRKRGRGEGIERRCLSLVATRLAGGSDLEQRREEEWRSKREERK
ncbi:hypothetical protein H5410_050744 [Solanum commersonii]|uniref:Secreted protein n=1 Tax=Solanum commersonii TaxID=4109 RepID=A0A9J5WXY3_SOLCO|nr:hypothetical protein H5410_050744 [Solanum commersonii]